MYDVKEIQEYALVGVLLGNKVIYNVVNNDVHFNETGRSIISLLNNNNNYFISEIIKSQSYNSIKYIFDDKIVFGEPYSHNNKNIDTLDLILKIEIDYIYIYDIENDLLLIKQPRKKLIALDYKISSDVRNFIRDNL